MKQITGKTYINWYEEMLFWRRFEDKLAAAYIQQKIREAYFRKILKHGYSNNTRFYRHNTCAVFSL